VIGLEELAFETSKTAATYTCVDESTIKLMIQNYTRKLGIVVLDIKEALEKYPWAEKYFWRLLDRKTDEYVKKAAEKEIGAFVYVPPGVKLKFPLQTCFFVSKQRIEQAVHNVMIVGDNSEVVLNTACAAAAGESIHIGVTEIYVGRGAKLTYAMVHGWNQLFDTRPRTAVHVDEGGTFIMNYVNLKPVRSLQAAPQIFLEGNSSAYISSTMLASKESFLDLGNIVELGGEGAKAEVISRAVAKDEARVIMRGLLRASAPRVKGHLECMGLQLSSKARVEAIPALDAAVGNVELTHEAAVGKIAEEELAYLMARGFDEREAVSMIVRGFVDTGLDYLPPSVRGQITIVLNMLAKMAVA